MRGVGLSGALALAFALLGTRMAIGCHQRGVSKVQLMTSRRLT